MILGRTNEVDGDFVATNFIAFVVPTQSMYFTERALSTTRTDRGGVPLQRDWRSVALGFGRVWLPVLAAASLLVAALRGEVLGWVGCALLVLASVLVHRAGGLPEGEKARLRVLGTVTGLRLDPAKLNPTARDVKRDSLGDLMEKGGIPLTPDGILSVLDDIPLPAMPLVYGYARYAGDDPVWRECAELVYLRYQQAEL